MTFPPFRRLCRKYFFVTLNLFQGLRDAEPILSQAQHKVQHDIFQHVAIATQSPRGRNVGEGKKGDEIGGVAKSTG
jgi:hypothetical protein